jgi:hypothetical protein
MRRQHLADSKRLVITQQVLHSDAKAWEMAQNIRRSMIGFIEFSNLRDVGTVIIYVPKHADH